MDLPTFPYSPFSFSLFTKVSSLSYHVSNFIPDYQSPHFSFFFDQALAPPHIYHTHLTLLPASYIPINSSFFLRRPIPKTSRSICRGGSEICLRAHNGIFACYRRRTRGGAAGDPSPSLRGRFIQHRNPSWMMHGARLPEKLTPILPHFILLLVISWKFPATPLRTQIFSGKHPIHADDKHRVLQYGFTWYSRGRHK